MVRPFLPLGSCQLQRLEMLNSFIFPSAGLALPSFLYILPANQAVPPRVSPWAWSQAFRRRPTALVTLCLDLTNCHFFTGMLSFSRTQRSRKPSTFWFSLSSDMENEVPKWPSGPQSKGQTPPPTRCTVAAEEGCVPLGLHTTPGRGAAESQPPALKGSCQQKQCPLSNVSQERAACCTV